MRIQKKSTAHALRRSEENVLHCKVLHKKINVIGQKITFGINILVKSWDPMDYVPDLGQNMFDHFNLGTNYNISRTMHFRKTVSNKKIEEDHQMS